MAAIIQRHEQNVSDAVHTFIMPVTPEFSWNETDGVVRMEVKLTSATSFTDNDVVASDVFVKVNCPPYLLQLDLFGYVDPEKTEVTVNKPCIKFKFFKQTKVPLCRLHLSRQRQEKMHLTHVFHRGYGATLNIRPMLLIGCKGDKKAWTLLHPSWTVSARRQRTRWKTIKTLCFTSRCAFERMLGCNVEIMHLHTCQPLYITHETISVLKPLHR